MFNEPTGGAVRILRGRRNKTMLDLIVMNIIETHVIALFVGQTGIPILEPDLSAGCAIQLVHCAGSLRMEALYHGLRCSGLRGGLGNEVIMVAKESPGLHLPCKRLCHLEECAVQQLQTQ